MGMGYAANYADTVDEQFVMEICPDEFKDFLSKLEKAAVELDDFAMDEEMEGDFQFSFQRLKNQFHQKTGLDLYLNYHGDGDRYDDISGRFWGVDGVYELTSSGKKYRDKITRGFYVTFG